MTGPKYSLKEMDASSSDVTKARMADCHKRVMDRAMSYFEENEQDVNIGNLDGVLVDLDFSAIISGVLPGAMGTSAVPVALVSTNNSFFCAGETRIPIQLLCGTQSFRWSVLSDYSPINGARERRREWLSSYEG